ncbi:MAG TPA: 2Fe-2S iron-sulfur cluster-binding protein [Candidatus Thermoplasmatota archaeon]|nr:2Fe-2S iron-sulfur cluster-binding protein [Candidatus Thermoplasmatota archaeon]
MDDLRVPGAPRGQPVTLRLDGRAFEAYEGETVGGALHASGEKVLMRSIKYHRPRGLFCCTGKCASCLMRVDGVPNVRACVTPVRDGMKVEFQNSFPSARRDVFSLTDKVFRKNFDYHARFIRPRFMAPVYNAVIRRMAGFGTIPDLRPVVRPTIQRREIDVLVVGAGPSGLAAAVAAAEGAASVLLVDEAARAGGTLLLQPDGRASVAEQTARLHEAGGESFEGTTAIGVYLTDGKGQALPSPGLVALMTPERVIEARPKALVVATGYHETPAFLTGNDLPGVMGTRAALSLLHGQGILPGRRIAFAGTGALTPRARIDLQKAGAEIVDGPVSEIWGGTRVEGAVVHDRKEELDCVLSAGDETPRIELLQQAGARLALAGWATGPTLDGVSTSVRGVFAAGSVADPRMPLDARAAMGARAGEAAAKHARGAR